MLNGLELADETKITNKDNLNTYVNTYIKPLTQSSDTFNLINHIHVGNTIENDDLVPAGTRILFPQVIKKELDEKRYCIEYNVNQFDSYS